MVGDGSLTRLSMADVRSVLSGGRTVYVGVGESENFLESANAALNSPLIDADVLNCCGALVNVTFGEHVDERRVEETLKYLSSHLPSSTNILWASRADGSLPKNTIKTLLVLCQSK